MKYLYEVSFIKGNKIIKPAINNEVYLIPDYKNMYQIKKYCKITGLDVSCEECRHKYFCEKYLS